MSKYEEAHHKFAEIAGLMVGKIGRAQSPLSHSSMGSSRERIILLKINSMTRIYIACIHLDIELNGLEAVDFIESQIKENFSRLKQGDRPTTMGLALLKVKDIMELLS